MLTCAYVKKINVKKNYWTCGIFNSLNIKFFISLNNIFLFLGTLTCRGGKKTKNQAEPKKTKP
jgi:hypothetical protein